jgi:hypothetical protein
MLEMQMEMQSARMVGHAGGAIWRWRRRMIMRRIGNYIKEGQLDASITRTFRGWTCYVYMKYHSWNALPTVFTAPSLVLHRAATRHWLP